MKISTKAKNTLAVFVMLALAAGSVAGLAKTASAETVWDLSGDYVISMNYNVSDYAHDLKLSQDIEGNITGNGGSPAGSNVYTWEITSGSVSGSSFEFDANYTATADAVTPQTVLHVEGTIALDGTLSGTWSDNYQGGSRS